MTAPLTTSQPVETIRKQVAHLAAECPTADDVARFFQDLGIKGYRGFASKCPVATWLNTYVDDESVMVATHATAWLGSINHESHDLEDHIVRNPQQVVEFIQNFDAGSYPALEIGE